MMTRKDYLETMNHLQPRVAHRQYYGQFVDERVKNIVLRCFGRTTITEEKDYHFSGYLRSWDSLVPQLPLDVSKKLKEAGDWLSLGTGVCILKEAATQIREDAKKETR